MNLFAQVYAVTVMNLQTIPHRLGASAVVVVGMACVVAVMVSVFSTSAGLMHVIGNTGQPDHAIVTSKGARGFGGSRLDRAVTLTAMDAPGVRKNREGRPIASVEVHFNIPVVRKSDGLDTVAMLFGVGPEVFALRQEIRLTEGRAFTPGLHELIVGRGAQSQFAGLDVGSKVAMPEGYWTIVGSFDGNESLFELGFLGDAETVLSMSRNNAFDDVVVQLDRPQSFEQFKEALAANPSLEVEAQRESDYYYNVTKQLNDFITYIAYGLGAIMGLGAMFGALNTMYSAVSARTTEIATLRAIGFGGGAIVLSIFVEVMALAVMGAAIGVAAAWLVFNGNIQAFGPAVLTLRVTPELAAIGLIWALAIGFVGGLFPAIRAVRLPVVAALKAQ